MKCQRCNGEGRIYNQDGDNEYIVCQDCNGTGTIDEGDDTFICSQCGQEVLERFRSYNNPSICETCDRDNED